jgi:hypothetical protein
MGSPKTRLNVSFFRDQNKIANAKKRNPKSQRVNGPLPSIPPTGVSRSREVNPRNFAASSSSELSTSAGMCHASGTDTRGRRLRALYLWPGEETDRLSLDFGGTGRSHECKFGGLSESRAKTIRRQGSTKPGSHVIKLFTVVSYDFS